ncbi:MAG: GDSL-type esterase/lipase family protein [Bacteroides sp.]|nr:GDSL-type esterase/lipase family protein [Bacteroides sp.]
MKKKISLLCAAAMVLSLTGCGGTAAENNENTESENQSMTENSTANALTEAVYTASGDNVKLLGRTYFDEDVLYCALSGTGAEFTFTGTKCSVVIKGDDNSANPGAADNLARIGIYLDGERVIDDMINESEKSYDVFESEEAKEVTVSVVKLSESPMSTVGIKEIKVTGSEIKPTPDKDMYIEFIGDSITCGYGIDDPDKDHHFVTSTEDVTKAYAYLTAQALNADYSIVSFSGYGIISGYTTNNEKVTSQTVPQFYTKLGYSWSTNGTFSPQNVEWDFSKRQPDLVVINLGTNDDSYAQSEIDRQNEYAEGYADFIKLIREKNPSARILCVFGVMGDRLYPFVEQAVESYTAETGDTNVSALQLRPQNARDGYSADWHPSVTTQQRAADSVVEEIQRLIG